MPEMMTDSAVALASELSPFQRLTIGSSEVRG